MTQLGFVLDLNSCMDLRGCMTGCKKHKDTPMGVYNVECFTNIGGEFPHAEGYFIPIPCQQCSKPSCVPACPPGNLVKDEYGVIVIKDGSKCITCESKPCIAACPYNALRADKVTGKLYKCDMCEELLEEGKQPACIAGCLTHSWYFGDFDDPESQVSKIIADYPKDFLFQLKPETGNGPNVFYLLSRRSWNDMNSLYTQNWHDE